MKIEFDQEILNRSIEAVLSRESIFEMSGKVDKHFKYLVLELYKALYELPAYIKEEIRKEEK